MEHVEDYGIRNLRQIMSKEHVEDAGERNMKKTDDGERNIKNEDDGGERNIKM